MSELDRIRLRIRNNPGDPGTQTLHRLVVALETRGNVDLAELYELDYDGFKLAIGVMDAWRLLRYAGVARNGIAERPVVFDQRVTKAAAEV